MIPAISFCIGIGIGERSFAITKKDEVVNNEGVHIGRKAFFQQGNGPEISNFPVVGWDLYITNENSNEPFKLGTITA